MKMKKPSIDWRYLPKKFKYLARDSSGDAYLFVSKPRADARYKVWSVAREDNWHWLILPARKMASYLPGDCDWKDSLVERPEE